MSEILAMLNRLDARLSAVPLAPEISLYQASEEVGLWTSSGGEYRSDRSPPFWAFAWAGGQGLARYVLDHPELVAGRQVLDLAAGSGLVAIAAAMAGAARVRAVDVDPEAVAAIELNARANGVAVAVDLLDLLAPRRVGDAEHWVDEAEVVLAGDLFYSAALADRARAFLRRAAQDGARVLVGDAQRGFLPEALFDRLANYDVPVPVALEDGKRKRCTVWTWRQVSDPR